MSLLSSPTAQLAGGYHVCETVYFLKHRATSLYSGEPLEAANNVEYSLEYGLRGKVVGPSSHDSMHLAVKFEGNNREGGIGCLPTELSRTKPPKEVRISERQQQRGRERGRGVRQWGGAFVGCANGHGGCLTTHPCASHLPVLRAFLLLL